MDALDGDCTFNDLFNQIVCTTSHKDSQTWCLDCLRLIQSLQATATYESSPENIIRSFISFIHYHNAWVDQLTYKNLVYLTITEASHLNFAKTLIDVIKEFENYNIGVALHQEPMSPYIDYEEDHQFESGYDILLCKDTTRVKSSMVDSILDAAETEFNLDEAIKHINPIIVESLAKRLDSKSIITSKADVCFYGRSKCRNKPGVWSKTNNMRCKNAIGPVGDDIIEVEITSICHKRCISTIEVDTNAFYTDTTLGKCFCCPISYEMIEDNSDGVYELFSTDVENGQATNRLDILKNLRNGDAKFQVDDTVVAWFLYKYGEIHDYKNSGIKFNNVQWTTTNKIGFRNPTFIKSKVFFDDGWDMTFFLRDWAALIINDANDFVEFIDYMLHAKYDRYETLSPHTNSYKKRIQVLSTFSSATGETEIPYLLKPRTQNIPMQSNVDWSVIEDETCSELRLPAQDLDSSECIKMRGGIIM